MHSTLTRGSHRSDFFHWRTTLSVLKLHKSAILYSFIWDFPLSIMFLRFIILCVLEVCSILLGEVWKQHLSFELNLLVHTRTFTQKCLSKALGHHLISVRAASWGISFHHCFTLGHRTCWLFQCYKGQITEFVVDLDYNPQAVFFPSLLPNSQDISWDYSC